MRQFYGRLEKKRPFCRKNHVHKIPRFRGGGILGFLGGGGVPILFLWARGFLWEKQPRSREPFRKVRVNFCLLPCDTSQESNGNCSDKLVQMNIFILGGFFVGWIFLLRNGQYIKDPNSRMLYLCVFWRRCCYSGLFTEHGANDSSSLAACTAACQANFFLQLRSFLLTPTLLPLPPLLQRGELCKPTTLNYINQFSSHGFSRNSSFTQFGLAPHQENLRSRVFERDATKPFSVNNKGVFSEKAREIQWMRGLVRISTGKAIQWRGPGQSMNRRTLKSKKKKAVLIQFPKSTLSVPKLVP